MKTSIIPKFQSTLLLKKEIKTQLVKNVSNQLILPYRFITILRLKGMASSLYCANAVSLFLF